MRVKCIDESRNYRENKRIREIVRDLVRRREGRKRYDRLMDGLKRSLEYRRGDLKEKYRAKTDPF